MSCCGGKCGCGSACKCGSGCNGFWFCSCGMYPDLAEASTTSTQTMIVGVAPVAGFEMPEMSFGAENDCKCGSNCTCTNCGCGK
ncbi:Metallothionein-like protein 4A [Linum grandiflorum]